MYHSINFHPVDSNYIYNTWNDFSLIPTKRPHMGPPEIEYVYQSELIYQPIEFLAAGNKRPIYKSRSASWEFAIDSNDANSKGRNWANLYSYILDSLHGRICDIVLEDDPDYTYRGRITINDWDSQEKYSVITIEALCEPYKFKPLKSHITNFGTSIHSGDIYTGTYTFSNTTDYETPAILALEITNGTIDTLTIRGLFTPKVTDVVTESIRNSSDNELTITNLVSGRTYYIDGINKSITYVIGSGSTKTSAMARVTSITAFPSIIKQRNSLTVRFTTESTTTNIKATISYYPYYL